MGHELKKYRHFMILVLVKFISAARKMMICFGQLLMWCQWLFGLMYTVQVHGVHGGGQGLVYTVQVHGGRCVLKY